MEPPISKAGDYITFSVEMNLIIAMMTCSALQSNGRSFEPIQFKID